jgi:hypothetical protein
MVEEAPLRQILLTLVVVDPPILFSVYVHDRSASLVRLPLPKVAPHCRLRQDALQAVDDRVKVHDSDRLKLAVAVGLHERIFQEREREIQ